MKITKTKFKDLLIIKNNNNIDKRGSLREIFNKKILNKKFENYKNFEKSFYPLIIKSFKTNLEHINGFWNSIDNMKDIKELNDSNNNKKFFEVEKIIKKIKNVK